MFNTRYNRIKFLIIMKKTEKIFIDNIAHLTQAMLERASEKHKSVNAYCIFTEGDHYHVLIPQYESEEEETRMTRKMMDVLINNKEICDAFAKFVMPPARYFEREAKKAAKAERNSDNTNHQ